MTIQEIIAMRHDEGLSYRAAAKKIGVSSEALRMVEQGHRPTARIGKKIADYYGTTYTELWPFDDEPVAA